MTQQSQVPKITLFDDNQIPCIGYGTFMIDKDKVYDCIKTAIDKGYRHFDCALMYENQKEIGKALNHAMKSGQITREQLFITSKVWPTYFQPGKVMECAKEILLQLQLDYVDLMLLHWPIQLKNGKKWNDWWPKDPDTGKVIVLNAVDIVDVYIELEQVKKKKLARSIGVSNFNSEQIIRILQKCVFQPVINQVECHPYLNQDNLIEFCTGRGIKLAGYMPLGGSEKESKPINPLEDEVIKKLAEKHGKTTAEIIIRWQIQRGVIVIPKSTHKDRVTSNFNVFDFELSTEDMIAINSMNQNKRLNTLENHGKELMDATEYPFKIPY